MPITMKENMHSSETCKFTIDHYPVLACLFFSYGFHVGVNLCFIFAISIHPFPLGSHIPVVAILYE